MSLFVIDLIRRLAVPMMGFGKFGLPKRLNRLRNSHKSSERTADMLFAARLELPDRLVNVFIALELGLMQYVFHPNMPLPFLARYSGLDLEARFSDSMMATACFWLLTFGPVLLPERSFPAFHLCITSVYGIGFLNLFGQFAGL
jgi:hypothetical protein